MLSLAFNLHGPAPTMIFSSIDFIIWFLPVVFTAFWLANLFSKRLAILVLCIASMAFYAYWKWEYTFLFAGSILVNYLCYRLIEATGKKSVLKAGIIANLALIALFKYADFFVSDVVQYQPWQQYVENIILPLGISFFTFQQISFLVDSYREKQERVSLLNYFAYVSFFPQLIAGPIVRHNEFLYQLNEKLRLDGNFVRGILFFSIGLAKKVLIADTLSAFVKLGYADPSMLTTLDAWMLSLLYTFQLYFDFSAYSDMAIGLALMFGLQLPQNFNSPYKSVSIQDFWRRWHMTLSRWLKDYLYIPLGGSRHGEILAYAALLATMFLGGLWHGAGWTFIVWGAAHGAALAINRAWTKAGYKLPAALGWFLTMLFVVNLWVVFRAENFGLAAQIYVQMWDVAQWVSPQALAQSVFDPNLWLALAALGIIVTTMPNTWQIDAWYTSNRAVARHALGYFSFGLLFMFSIKRLMESSAPAEFIYFQF